MRNVTELSKLNGKVYVYLRDEVIARMSTAERYVYDDKMKRALIIDGKESSHSLDFAKMISDHYLSADTSHHLWRFR